VTLKNLYLFRKMSINVLLTSLAILLVTFSTPTLTSPLAAVREQAHESNSLANLRGFMSDLKTKLRGELALLMALEEQDVEQERRPTGPHPLRNRPMPFGAQSFLSDRSRRTENEDERPAHPLAGWGSLFNDS